MLDAPLAYDSDKPTGNISYPTWFPRDSLAWLGDESASFRLSGTSTLLGGGQWFVHDAKTYMVSSQEFAEDFNIKVYKVIIDGQANSFVYGTCVYRSKKLKNSVNN
jgi:hypothetical protein